jgi:tetratricopeptide (TPR) repeat protein
MRKLMTSFLFILFSTAVFAQRNEEVVRLVNEGIAFHDDGDYESAVKKYDAALKISPNDYDANYEKSLSLLYAKKYEACITLSRSIIQQFSADQNLKQVYSNLGSALDDAGKTDEAIKVYTEGIEKYSGYYLLYFNRGLTYMRMKQYTEALADYSLALKDNALHPSSNYYSAIIIQDENRIPSLLAYMTFIAVEPASQRTKKAFEAIQEIVYRNIKNDGNNTTISISKDLLDKKKNAENDFSDIELAFSIVGSMDNAKGLDSITKTAADKFDFKLQMLINALSNGQKGGKGFYWEHYVPFFVDLKKNNYTQVLSNIVYLSGDKDAQDWIDKNKEKVNAFYNWFQSYEWKER